MSAEPRVRKSALREKVRDPRAFKKFLEELSWVLSTYSNLDFKALAQLNLSHNRVNDRGLQPYVSKNPNAHFLVGALPVMFSNERLFVANEDIADFAREALSLPISRWEKRSRYELIGLIVCETTKLDDDGLARLVDALSSIIGNDVQARRLFQERRAKKLSWGEMIRRLSIDDGEE